MAIVKMKRLSLLALRCDKDKIYDALIKSNVVQLKRTEEATADVQISQRLEEQLSRLSRVENAIEYIQAQTEAYNARNHKNKVELPKNSFSRPKTELDFDYFLSFGQNALRIETELDHLDQLKDSLAQTELLCEKNRAEFSRLLLYKQLRHPPTWFVDTESCLVRLCQLPASEIDSLLQLQQQYALSEVQVLGSDGTTTIVAVTVHRSQKEFLEKAAAYGLVACPLKGDVLPVLILEQLESEHAKLSLEKREIENEIVSLGACLPEWKIYADYIDLCAKKVQADGDITTTESTFVLEGYYPAEEEQKVNDALQTVSFCMVYSFAEIGEEEFAPTLVRNNKIVKQFEIITNSYTPPDYHEVDPNPVMAIFYFIIFGFMVADIGYGFLLMLAGLFAAIFIKQPSGLKTMVQLFGICGLSAVLVGALFGSCFSYTLFEPIIPDPSVHPMVLIVISLLLGVVHICAGIGCSMAVKIKHKQALAAWLADFPWIVTFIALVLSIWNSALDMAAYQPYMVLKLPQSVSQIALYVCLASLAVGIVFAGVGQKGFFGKVSKSFGSVYGILNYFSDIMSYIRVFGLMLSSALMGAVVNDLGTMIAQGGGFGYVMAAAVLVFAHAFNLAMGLLSVYIHNGRLQYMEFFGKFYSGEGVLFVPFGSDTKYTLLKSK